MDADTLRPWQAMRMLDVLRPTLGYLSRLQSRMEKVGFLPTDPLYVGVRLEYDAMHSLCMDLHYRSCQSGVGKPTDEVK